MQRIRKVVRRALGRSCRPCRRTTATFLKSRLALAFALVVAALGSAFGPPASPSVAVAEPVARYRLIVKEVLVHDDHEGFLSGKGEMELTISVIHCPDELPSPCYYEGRQVGAQVTAKHSFKGGTGEAVPMHRVVPDEGDDGVSQNISPELGFYAFSGYYHLIRFDMVEVDSVTNNEPMGWALHSAETAKGGAGIGTFSVRSLKNQGAKPGDYTVTFEIVPVELPDVRTARIEISDIPNSPKKHVCAVVQNIRDTPAGPFQVYILINGGDSEGGRPVIASLGPGAVASACVDTALPATGQYDITVLLDLPHRLDEFNETNNILTQYYTAAPKPAAPEATSKPAAPDSSHTPASEQADLTVAAVKVNGQAPDGKDDCKAGKNAVSVIVKNEGAAKADSFVVRLKVDEATGDGLEQTVNGLEAGKEREVKFENVRLNKGEQTLTATADAKDDIAESNEANNDRAVTARCKDAS